MVEALKKPIILSGVLILPTECGGGEQTSTPDVLIKVFEICADAYVKEVRRIMLLGEVGNDEVAKTLHLFNTLLISRDLPPMAVRQVEPDSASDRKIKRAYAEREEVRSRRAFLRPKSIIDPEPSPTTPLAAMQSVNADHPKTTFAVTPEIEAQACTGCDACLRICPTGVLTKIKDDADRTYYNVSSVSCDACGLCLDVCATGAIRLATMSQTPAKIPLITWTCAACGVPVCTPEAQGRNSGMCNICATTGHHKKLFQVLK